MIKIKKVIPLLCCLIFTSCINSALDDVLFRTIDDPFYDVPVLDFLSKANTIQVSWKEDKGADIYILYRSIDARILDFKQIYSGTETEYIDTDVTSGSKYIYRLDKKRGNTTFSAKNYTGGAAFDVINDSCENNSKNESPIFLEYEKYCNIHCISFEYQGPELEKKIFNTENFFYVTIPPMRTAEIIITEKDNIDETSLLFQIGSLKEPELKVPNGTAIHINNTDYVTKNIYFYIRPSLTYIFKDSPTGSRVINYNIYLDAIVNYTH